MVFIVLEIQSNEETATCLVNTYSKREDAESKYHQILQYAAVSAVVVHSAVLMTDTGKTLKTEKYEHKIESE